MKKAIAFMLCILMAMTAVAGCSAPATDKPDTTANAEATPAAAEATPAAQQPTEEKPVLELTIAHSAAGGTWNTIAEGLAEVLRNEYPGSSITVVPGSGEGNIAQMHSGQVDLALTTSADAKDAMMGVEHFAGNAVEDVQAICALFSPAVQIFVMDNVPVNSMEELIQAKYPIKISVHTQGSGIEIAARRVLEAYGISYADIESWGGKIYYAGSADAAEMMGNGQIDAYFGFSTIPISNFTELNVQHDFKLLALNDDVIAKMKADWEYPAGIIPAGSYGGIDTDIPTIAETTGLYASPALDQDTIYYVTKAILNHLDELGNIHARLADLTTDYMQSDTVYPLAEGALRAYSE